MNISYSKYQQIQQLHEMAKVQSTANMNEYQEYAEQQRIKREKISDEWRNAEKEKCVIIYKNNNETENTVIELELE